MKRRASICLCVAMALLLIGCKATKPLYESKYERDSTSMMYWERVLILPDTTEVYLPHQTAERTTYDTISILETDYAKSIAVIMADGSLSHRLDTKQQPLLVPTENKIVYRDLKVDKFQDRIVEKVVEKEKPLSWWRKTQIFAFYGLLPFLVIKHTIKRYSTLMRVFQKK